MNWRENKFDNDPKEWQDSEKQVKFPSEKYSRAFYRMNQARSEFKLQF